MPNPLLPFAVQAKKVPISFGLSAVLILCSFPAQAMFGNYNSILIGEQATGMGGAATAVVGDVSSCAFYNPATCAQLEGKSFAAAVGIYKKFDTVYGEDLNLAKAGMSVNQGFFQALPSSTGSITHFSDFPNYAIALSIVVPEYDTFNGDISNNSTSKTNLSFTDQSLWVGASISKKSEKSSLGMTVYYTARSFSKTLTDRTLGGLSYEEQKAFTQNTFVAVLGYYRRWDDNWAYGISARLPSWQIAGQATYFDNNPSNPAQPNDFPSLASHVHIPSKLTAGVSYEEKGSMTLSLDVTAYSHEAYDDIEATQPGVSEHLENRAIVNVNAGTEFFIKNWLKMRAGVFTNMSSYPNPDPNKVRGEGDHVDMLGWSSNVAIESGPITYTFGGYYIGGRGLSAQRINQNLEVIAKSQQVFTMLVASSFSY